MGQLDGKVAFITGAARGQGRSHALRLAREGADIIGVDLCEQVGTVQYAMSTPEDLAQTAKEVEDLDRRIVTRQADVRDKRSLQEAFDAGVAELGRVDIILANAGIANQVGGEPEDEERGWQDVIDINLTGAWKTVKATVPHMIEAGRKGSVILTSSVAGLIAFPNLAHYTAAKHGVTGLMRVFAIELAGHGIRVNSIHPATVDTPMVSNPFSYELFLGGVKGATREEAALGMAPMNALNIPWVETIDVSNAVLYLASDESRYVTGTTSVIDAGAMAPFKIPHG